jgi:hypothetical protein
LAAWLCWVEVEPGRLAAVKMLVLPLKIGSFVAMPKAILGISDEPTITWKRLIWS